MSSKKLILLHAPSVYDFRSMDILHGPINDLVPSSSVFEMYPIGFVPLAAHLEDHGYPVRIINLAARMLRDSEFDAEQLIKNLTSPLLFGIDLHWLPHAHGALEIASLVKRYHPHTPILLGGFSATYFHRELIDYPQVDFVIRGDSTEDALLKLMDCLAQGGAFSQIPNLTWRDESGEVTINPLQHSLPDLSGVNLDFRRLMIAAMRDRDLPGYLPFSGWFTYPIMPVLSCRGCLMNCVGCGGSAFAFQKLHGRASPAYRPPDKLATDIRHITSVSNGPVFVIGDIRQAGRQYAMRFLEAAKGIDTPVMLELFWPASREFLTAVAEAFPHFALEMSIESHDPLVRKAFGKAYSNERIEETIQTALNLNVNRLDIFFMIGLPRQTYQSVLDTATYAERLLEKHQAGPRLRPFIGPMAPFVDPGSLAFEQPKKYGYRIFHRTLEEHRQALLEPSWQFTLNYETKWMTRREIVLSTYDAGLRFSELKTRYGLINATEGEKAQYALREGRALALKIEQLRDANDLEAVRWLRPRINEVNAIRVLEEESELEIPVSPKRFKFVYLISMLIWAWFDDKWKKVRQLRRHRPYYRRGQA